MDLAITPEQPAPTWDEAVSRYRAAPYGSAAEEAAWWDMTLIKLNEMQPINVEESRRTGEIR